VLEILVLGVKRRVELVVFLDWDVVVRIPEVLSSISDISGTGYRFITMA
jgi:hypothetical protein